jgi:hypothetical protein
MKVLQNLNFFLWIFTFLMQMRIKKVFYFNQNFIFLLHLLRVNVDHGRWPIYSRGSKLRCLCLFHHQHKISER